MAGRARGGADDKAVDDSGAAEPLEVSVAELVFDPSESPVVEAEIAARAAAEPLEHPRDGTIRGPLVYSDMQCPLIPGGGDRRRVVETLTNAEGKPIGQVVHRQPEQVVSSPTACGDCGKILERYQLIPNYVTGERSCPQVVSLRNNPRYKRLFGLVDERDAVGAKREAEKLGEVGAAILEVFFRAEEPIAQ